MHRSEYRVVVRIYSQIVSLMLLTFLCKHFSCFSYLFSISLWRWQLKLFLYLPCISITNCKSFLACHCFSWLAPLNLEASILFHIFCNCSLRHCETLQIVFWQFMFWVEMKGWTLIWQLPWSNPRLYQCFVMMKKAMSWISGLWQAARRKITPCRFTLCLRVVRVSTLGLCFV